MQEKSIKSLETLKEDHESKVEKLTEKRTAILNELDKKKRVMQYMEEKEGTIIDKLAIKAHIASLKEQSKQNQAVSRDLVEKTQKSLQEMHGQILTNNRSGLDDDHSSSRVEDDNEESIDAKKMTEIRMMQTLRELFRDRYNTLVKSSESLVEDLIQS